MHPSCCIIGPPSSVYLIFEESVLMQTESTIVECTAIGGESPEIFNLTLWRNGELLAQVSGDHLTYTTSSGSYGTYTCDVDGVQNSSVLQERGKHNTIRFVRKVFYIIIYSEVSVAIGWCQYYSVPFVNGKHCVFMPARLSCVGLAPLPCSL